MSDMVALGWQEAASWLPETPRCVLATDLECHFIAVFQDGKWFEAHSDEEIDSVITHWQELPEVPEA